MKDERRKASYDKYKSGINLKKAPIPYTAKGKDKLKLIPTRDIPHLQITPTPFQITPVVTPHENGD